MFAASIHSFVPVPIMSIFVLDLFLTIKKTRSVYKVVPNLKFAIDRAITTFTIFTLAYRNISFISCHLL